MLKNTPKLFYKKLFTIALVCVVIISLVSCCRALTRHFEELRQQDPYKDAAGIYSTPPTYGYYLGIPEEYVNAFDNCHRFLWRKQNPTDPIIVDDQKKEDLVVSVLPPERYDSVTLCEVPPEDDSAISWTNWMEVLPALESNGVYWDFCYPVTEVVYKDPYDPNHPSFEKNGDYGHVIVNKENNKVVGYIFPEYLNDE